MGRRPFVASVTLWLGAALCLGATARAQALPDLATIRAMQARSQWAASESLATAALADLSRRSKPDSLAIAEASYLLGVAHMRNAGYADGLALADGMRARDIRARQLGSVKPPVAEAELLVGRALQGADRTDSALVHLRRAIDIYTATLAVNDTLIAEAWSQYALCRRDRREFKEALDAWDRAIEVRSDHDGAESAPVALLKAQTGACWMELNDQAKAREVLEGSLATFARIGQPDHPSRWVPLNILADLEGRQGNLARDVDLTQEATRIVRLNFGDDSRQALTLRGNLATVLERMRDYEGSLAILREVLPAVIAQYGPNSLRTLGLRFGEARTLAWLESGDGALRHYTQLESLLVAGPPPARAALGAALQQHAELLMDHGKLREAVAMCDSAQKAELANPNPSPFILAQARTIRMDCYIYLGDKVALAAARDELNQFIAKYGPRPTSNAAAMPFMCARADQALGRRDTAWVEGLEAERLTREAYRANLRQLPDRGAFGFASGTLGELDFVLVQSRGDTSRTQAAWDRLALKRGTLRAELAQRTIPPGFANDAALVAAHDQWRSTQDRYARLLVRGTPRDSAGRATMAHARVDAENAEQSYARELSQRSAGVVPREHGLTDVRAALKPGQALIAMATNGGLQDSARISAFVARGGDPHLTRVELGYRNSIATLVAPWLAALSTPPGAKTAAKAEMDCRRLGERVRVSLWDPLAHAVGDASEVFIVSEAPLEDFPWAALPKGSGGYFAESGALIHPLDAEVALLDAAPSTKGGTLLAVGAPDFQRAEAAPASGAGGPVVAAVVRSAPDACSDGKPLALPPLPGSGAEVTEIQQAWKDAKAGDAHLIVGANATEPAFKSMARGCTVIHVATHGVMRGDRCDEASAGTRGVGGVAVVASTGATTGAKPKSLDSSEKRPYWAPAVPPSPWLQRRVWLALAGANHAAEHSGDNDEGLLTAEEVATLDLGGTDWVVLSACHSGAGDAWSSEGRLGMRRAFAMAGARSVIASSWALDDASTGEWMTALYAARLKGDADAALAIRDADRTTLAERRARKLSTHPFYWAAFSASGR